MVLMKISEIVYEEKIYPRGKVDMNVVNQYRESIDKLPPLVVDGKNRLIDGYHRLLAYRQEHYETVDVEVFDCEDDGECLLEAIRRNATHGKQLSSMEKKRHALTLYDLKKSDELILSALSISKATFYEWTKDKRKEEKEERDQRILDLWLACWTEEEIAKETEVPRKTIDDVIHKWIGENSEIGKIAKEPPSCLQFTNLWSFDVCDPAFGEKGYAGRMPAQVIQNLLWFFTEPFDMVLDPMAGSGTTLDVCKSMFRRYLAYDLNPIEAKGIQKWDVLDGLPLWNAKVKPKLIVLDPPYADQKKGEYTDMASDFSNMPHIEFQNNIIKLLNDCVEKLEADGTIALIISSSKKEKIVTDWSLIFGNNPPKGFHLAERIIVPYENAASMTGYWIENAKKNKQMLRAYRDLLIFQKAL